MGGRHPYVLRVSPLLGEAAMTWGGRSLLRQGARFTGKRGGTLPVGMRAMD